jgi:hypothetical protein
MELISKSHQSPENQKEKNLGRGVKVLPPPLNDEQWELFKSLHHRWEVNFDVITTENHSNKLLPPPLNDDEWELFKILYRRWEVMTKDTCPYCGSKKQGVSHADR